MASYLGTHCVSRQVKIWCWAEWMIVVVGRKWIDPSFESTSDYKGWEEADILESTPMRATWQGGWQKLERASRLYCYTLRWYNSTALWGDHRGHIEPWKLSTTSWFIVWYQYVIYRRGILITSKSSLLYPTQQDSAHAVFGFANAITTGYFFIYFGKDKMSPLDGGSFCCILRLECIWKNHLQTWKRGLSLKRLEQWWDFLQLNIHLSPTSKSSLSFPETPTLRSRSSALHRLLTMSTPSVR